MLGVGAGFLMLVLLMPAVVAPDRALVLAVRAMTPTGDAMKHGDKNKSWPG